MSWTRRDLMRWLSAAGALSVLGSRPGLAQRKRRGRSALLEMEGPAVVSTWPHGKPANAAALAVLAKGGSALDAVEAGARVSEADPEVRSVGRGGRPNEEGVVQLDAAVMDGATHRAGAVAALERTLHPVSVARRVMEQTHHVLLVGDGARRFARAQGFEETELLTEASREAWLRWKRSLSKDDFWRDPSNHDTIGVVARDAEGRVAAACTTSGLAWKLPGRVGDSPLVGHGLYADRDAGAAAATGIGEAVIRGCGSFLVVEGMRQGLEPEEACRRALRRIHAKEPELGGQVAFVAVRADGRSAGVGLREGFSYAVGRGERNELLEGQAVLGEDRP